MGTLLLIWSLVVSAVSGEIIVDARVAARVALEGRILADLFEASEVRVRRPEGAYRLVVTVDGEPRSVRVQVPEAGSVRVLVSGRGVTPTVSSEAAPAASGSAEPRDLKVLAVGGVALMFQVGGERHAVSGSRPLTLALEPGRYPVAVRSKDGSVIFARGTLVVGSGEGDGVVQIAEGLSPEVSGDGLEYSQSGG